MEFFIIIGCLLLVYFIFYVLHLKVERNEYKNKYYKTNSLLNDCNKVLDNLKLKNKELELELNKYLVFYENVIEKMYEDSLLFPNLINVITQSEKIKDDFISDYYRYKKNPAIKASEEITKLRKDLREKNKEFLLTYNRVTLYESLAPWLVEFTDLSLNELLNSLKEERELKNTYAEEIDPVSLFVNKTEWSKLNIDDRNQLALDRYLNPKRKKSLWQVGIDYERYVGYYYEQQGFSVKYHGALKVKEDLGIDLVCTKENMTFVIQCKRLSHIKEIPVRENVIAQIFGASKYYGLVNNIQNIQPIIITTYKLSDEAKEFAKYLNVGILEDFKIKQYPMIKCNISNKTGEKIYHLPFDQQYDSIIIEKEKGECYVFTVKEAVNKGFRRAYKWKSL